jgi:hypothetical protein
MKTRQKLPLIQNEKRGKLLLQLLMIMPNIQQRFNRSKRITFDVMKFNSMKTYRLSLKIFSKINSNSITNQNKI